MQKLFQRGGGGGDSRKGLRLKSVKGWSEEACLTSTANPAARDRCKTLLIIISENKHEVTKMKNGKPVIFASPSTMTTLSRPARSAAATWDDSSWLAKMATTNSRTVCKRGRISTESQPEDGIQKPVSRRPCFFPLAGFFGAWV